MLGTKPFTCLASISMLHFIPGPLIFEMVSLCVAHACLEFVNNLSDYDYNDVPPYPVKEG